MSGTDRITDYGFTFGAMEVTRLTELPDGRVCLGVRTPYREVQVYASATGRSLRIFDKAGEWSHAVPADSQPQPPSVTT